MQNEDDSDSGGAKMVKFLRWLAATSKRPEAEIVYSIMAYNRAMMI